MRDPKKFNPFSKLFNNLTEQMLIVKQDPGLAKQLQEEAKILDAEYERKKRTRTLGEFNEMTRDGKVQFIQAGGEIV